MATIGGLGIGLIAVQLVSLAPSSQARAAWPWKWRANGAQSCGTPGCGPVQSAAPAGWGGEWHWMQSPDQERRVVMSLYNRLCIRCHGIDGRGVWDIPCVPDFTDPRWQASRPDPQIVNIVIEGRVAADDAAQFRGTLTLEECARMAHYLAAHRFVPGTEGPSKAPRRSAMRLSGPVKPPH